MDDGDFLKDGYVSEKDGYVFKKRRSVLTQTPKRFGSNVETFTTKLRQWAVHIQSKKKKRFM